MRVQPHQVALCCIISVRLLLFLNRKTETEALIGKTDGVKKTGRIGIGH
jgi:hypothetical protein